MYIFGFCVYSAVVRGGWDMMPLSCMLFETTIVACFCVHGVFVYVVNLVYIWSFTHECPSLYSMLI